MTHQEIMDHIGDGGYGWYRIPATWRDTSVSLRFTAWTFKDAPNGIEALTLLDLDRLQKGAHLINARVPACTWEQLWEAHMADKTKEAVPLWRTEVKGFSKGITDADLGVGESSSDTKPSVAMKHDKKKPRYSLLDRAFVWGIVKVLEFGAEKYEVNNWRKGFQYSRILDAAQRHLDEFSQGNRLDEETGLPHLYHLGCCIMFLSRFDATAEELPEGSHVYTGLDDRAERLGYKLPTK